MKRPLHTTSSCTPITSAAREQLGGDVLVSINHLPTSVSIVLTAAEARALALHIIRTTDALVPSRKDA